ncbi:MAG: glycosyltransferase [Mycobacteriales bacterium]
MTVVVSSHGRAELLTGLLDALEAQSHQDFSVVVADNGSADDTWPVLTQRCAVTPLRLRAIRLTFHDGPAVPRNTCIAETESPLIAFTDDDCLPTPGWLAAITAAFHDDTALVQGRTVPEPGGWGGPWGRSLAVTTPSGLYETANLAARRAAVLAVGGFPIDRLLSGRAFGEDVVLGAAVARTGGFRFAPDALVHHRVMPGTYRDFLEERKRLIAFPLLLRQVPELRRHTWLRIFLSRRSAVTDLAVAGLIASVVASFLTQSAWQLTTNIAYVPWLIVLWREAGTRPGRARLMRAAQVARADLTGFAALLAGSLAARRVLI